MAATKSSVNSLLEKFIIPDSHKSSDYFTLLRELVASRNNSDDNGSQQLWQDGIDRVYALLDNELRSSKDQPLTSVKFGTSGWRGLLGKDLFVKSVAQVTMAITELYHGDITTELQQALGVDTLAEAQSRGCVLGFDNRFGGELLAASVADVLTGTGFTVHYAGESTTGVLSAALLEANGAFSINLTPSHNPLEYGGFKFNAADGGPAAKVITDQITANAGRIIENNLLPSAPPRPELIKKIEALTSWQNFVRKGTNCHKLDYDQIIDDFFNNESLAVAIDSVHGASRIHVGPLFKDRSSERLLTIRDNVDPTFGGIAPEPSPANMNLVREALAERHEPLKLGMVIDPDGDRIRFTDGLADIEMNKFGAAAYHYLHEHKGLSGLVAKSVATSNFANAITAGLGEEVFESRVGFKEFKPVIGQALVYFEESDGISIIGHTPEKDAYIGLLLALDMTMSLNRPLSVYIRELEEQFGAFHPDRAAIKVSIKGKELLDGLAKLEKYRAGSTLLVGNKKMDITEVIDIDGRKIILADDSWLLIRPSGTEPKVRFYVEARTASGRHDLLNTARRLLAESGILA
ncbi:MAG: phosphoglucomutase [Thermodesulfobacteriota bacterium]